MNQPTSHVENGKTANPRNQQNDKQYRPDAHLRLLSLELRSKTLD
jgi:hypothetical protein